MNEALKENTAFQIFSAKSSNWQSHSFWKSFVYLESFAVWSRIGFK